MLKTDEAICQAEIAERCPRRDRCRRGDQRTTSPKWQAHARYDGTETCPGFWEKKTHTPRVMENHQ